MNEIIEKLVSLEREISAEKGEFFLFALFLREGAPDKWDLVASAPWLRENMHRALVELAAKLRSAFDPDELLFLSRIVLFDQDDPALEAVFRAVNVEHISVEVRNCKFFGMVIEHAYIITSKRPSGEEPESTDDTI